MRRIVILFSLLVAGVASAEDFDLPEVLCYIEGTPPGSTRFAYEYCWAGDQNGDGYDDLLVNHDPWVPGRELVNAVNRVELYYGGEEMDDEPDRFIRNQLEVPDSVRVSFAHQLAYLGNLIPDDPSYLLTASRIIEFPIAYRVELQIGIYKSGDFWDDNAEFRMQRDLRERRRNGQGLGFGHAHRSRPFDFNGDGSDDIVAVEELSDTSLAVVTFYGGEEFDTIPDWRTTVYQAKASQGYDMSVGYDVNGDGYDDIFTKLTQPNGAKFFQIYLGGEEPDTIPILSFSSRDFEGAYVINGFSLLPDVNGDGYDDWGVYWMSYGGFTSGYYLFYGGEEPDIEIDVFLEENNGPMTGDGDLCGGDFNGDGYNDIVTASRRGFRNNGEIHIHFGRRDLPHNMDADIVINAVEDYGDEFRYLGEYIGAVGDYNGDGIDDFIARVSHNRYEPKLVIFASNREWVVPGNTVDTKLPSTHELSMEAHPNPFNSTTTLTFNLPSESHLDITLYDISGRQVITLFSGVRQAGKWSTTLNGSNLSSGIYFIKLNSGDLHMSQKVVLIK